MEREAVHARFEDDLGARAQIEKDARARRRWIVSKALDGAGVLDDEEARRVARRLQHLHRLLEAERGKNPLMRQPRHAAALGGDAVRAAALIEGCGATGGE